MKIFRKTALGLACRLVMLMVLLLVGGTSVGMYGATKPWAKYENGTLTFYYGEKSSLGTDEYELNTGDNAPGWTTHNTNITKVVFDESFTVARPTSCYYWFYGMNNLEEIENLSNFNTEKVLSMEFMFRECSSLKTLDLSNFNTENVTTMLGMFFRCENLQFLNVSNFNTAKVGNMLGMFRSCLKLQSLDLSSFNTANVTNMSYMFHYCENLQSLDLLKFNTENVTTMQGMFYHCNNLQSLDLSSFNTANVTNMSSMFFLCFNLKAIYASDKFTTDKVTSSDKMFDYCRSLSGDIEYDKNYQDKTYAKIDGGYFRDKAYDRPWVKYADGTLTFMYGYKRIIDGSNSEYELNSGENVPGWNEKNSSITKVVFDESFKNARPTTGFKWFSNCNMLTEIENISYLNTSEMTDMGYMFTGCSSLQSLDLSSFNTANVTDMSNMFYNCNKLKGIYASDKFTTSSVTSSDKMFDNCESLSGDIEYDKNYVDKTYAKIEGGYFRDKAYANRPWVKYADGTLTFLYGYKRIIDGSKGEYELNSGKNVPGWNEKNSSITKVVFDESFKNARPTTGYKWFFDYWKPTEIENITYLNTSEMTDMGYMFTGCSSLQSLDLSNFNTAKVTDMYMMFHGCSSLQSLDLSNFNTAKVTDMYMMFYMCTQLQSLDLSSFNTAKVTDMRKMFYTCSQLQSLDLSSFNTAMVKDMESMFEYCSNLQSLDLSSFNTANVESMINMFYKCSKLQSLDLSSFNTTKVTDMRKMFYTCSKLQSIIISKDFTTKSLKYITEMFSDCPAKLYTTMADYMARTDDKKIDAKVINPYFPINAKAEYGTLCSPVGGTLGEGTFYGFDKLYEVDADKTDDTKVVMKGVSAVEAGKPYIYRRNLTDSDPVANAIVFNIDNTATSAPQNLGMLKGTFESMIAPGGSYILQTDGMFHRVNDSNETLKVGAYRAYLDLSSLGGEARTISMSFDDSETTGIREVNTSDSSNAPIYDLTGRRINTPQRGQIYIQNSKKVLF